MDINKVKQKLEELNNKNDDYFISKTILILNISDKKFKRMSNKERNEALNFIRSIRDEFDEKDKDNNT